MDIYNSAARDLRFAPHDRPVLVFDRDTGQWCKAIWRGGYWYEVGTGLCLAATGWHDLPPLPTLATVAKEGDDW